MVNQMWVTSQTNIMPMAGTGGVTTAQGVSFASPGISSGPFFTGPKITYRKKSRFMKMLGECKLGRESESNKDIYYHYREQTLGGFLPQMHFNPMYNGRPRREILPLLLCAPSAMKFFNQNIYYYYGLVVLEPMIANRRAKRARLSYAGLELIDYWVENFPKFKPFVDAYITKKARREITADALGYKLGFLPSRFGKMKEMHDKEVALNRDTPNRRKFANRVERKRQELMAQQAAYFQQAQTTAMPPWAQQAMQTSVLQQQALMAQQQYNNMISGLPMQPQVFTIPNGGTGATDTTARSNLGVASTISRLFGRK